jgi:hypothetical protein
MPVTTDSTNNYKVNLFKHTAGTVQTSEATREIRARTNNYQQLRKTTPTLLCWYTVPEHLPKDE